MFWLGCRQNAIRLEENEKREKEIRNRIIEEGEEHNKAFYEKRKLNIETNKTNNRDKENVSFFPESCEFHPIHSYNAPYL